MAKTKIETDHGLNVRMFITGLMLVVLYLVITTLLIYAGLSMGLVLVIVVAMIFSQYYFSDKIAMFSMHAHEVSAQEEPRLHEIVDRLCLLANMPKPRVAVADTDIPNAFATGRSPSRAVVCVTTGLLRRLEVDELEGVLSHELSHVEHRDVTVMTVASFAGVVAGLLTRMWMWGGMSRGRDRDQNAAFVFLAVMLVSVLVYVVSFLLTRALSRYRELSADRSGALLTGNPSALASALRKVSGDIATIPDRDLRQAEAVSAFAFAPTLTSEKSLATLFMTHPPLDKRLEQLAKIAAQLGQR